SEAAVAASPSSTSTAETPTTASLTQQQYDAFEIIQTRCSQCHSSAPTDDVFKVAQGGAMFDSWQDVERWKSRILARAVVSGDMPFLNKTKMTDEERQRLGYLLNTIN
ncbi:MAG: hypothetical protein ACK5MF_17240, partial [Vibrio sp.]